MSIDMEEFELHSEWCLTSIENILAQQSDGKLVHQGWSPQCERVPAEHGEWGVLKTTAIQDGFFLEEENKRLPEGKEPKPRIEVKAGDLLVTNAGPRARCGVICFVNRVRTKLMISGKMYRLRFPDDKISPRFVESWLRTSFAQKEFNERKTGISESGLNMTQTRFLTLPVVVAPVEEQKVIANKLDTLLAQVEDTKARLERIPQILKRFRQSVLAAAVSGRLTEEWREGRVANRTFEEFLKQLETLRQKAIQEENKRTGKKSKYKAVKIDTSNAPAELPESWNWVPVEALATKVTDGVHKKPAYVSSGVPFITVKNLTKGNGISFSETNFISENDHEEFRKRTNPEMGDILISKDGTLGVVRQIRTNKAFSIFVSVALVKPADRRMSDYLEIAFQSPVVQGQMIGVGTGLQHIHLTDLRKDLIPVPPLEEQTEIVRRVDQLFAHADRIEQQVNNALSRINNLTQSILAKAFRGELTEQWRKDNPELISGENSAEALLERIKAERAAQKPAGRRTKNRKSEQAAK